MKYEEEKLKLIFVLKIGYNSKYEGLYEFIFSLDETNIDVEGWCWDIPPACDNAMPPTEESIDATFSLKTKSFNLNCLHENINYPYMFGYNTIHALAYESEEIDFENNDGHSDYERMFEGDGDDVPLLVFHYGMTLAKVKELLAARRIILKNNEFIETASLKF